MDVEYHHTHDEQLKGNVRFQYVTSMSNPADLLTKPLAAPRHEQLLELIGLVRIHLDQHTKSTDRTSDSGRKKGVCTPE
jgi:hypothetical protein